MGAQSRDEKAGETAGWPSRSSEQMQKGLSDTAIGCFIEVVGIKKSGRGAVAFL